jgi:ketosteroid isomerase-like protein
MVESALTQFIERCHKALTQQSQGHPDPLLELWSHADDVSLMAAVNGFQLGFEQVSTVLRWASKSQQFDSWSAENLATIEGSELACSVELEHYVRVVDGNDEGMTLRATQVYRLENGEWRILHRHGDTLTDLEVKW